MPTPATLPTPVPAPTVKKSGKYLAPALFLLLLVILLSLALVGFQRFWREQSRSSFYQAVFLTNGQVYFGKLQPYDARQVMLTDVYYVQVNQDLQSGSNQNTNTSAETNANTNTPNLSLIKLGEELHGPQDKLFINRDHILFTEDLKESSQVVQAIRTAKDK